VRRDQHQDSVGVRCRIRRARATIRRGPLGSAATLGTARPALLGLALAATAILALSGASSASAAEPTHPLVGPFGTAAQPTFGQAAGMTVDPATGDLYVIDLEDQTLHRFQPDGEPDPFSALGSNVIDGHAGEADATPQGEILSNNGSAAEVEVAVDSSGGTTDGDIYVTDSVNNAIDIFASDGHYLGQLTASGTESFSEACGVAVDPSGDVYVASYSNGIAKFTPSANPPTDGDSTGPFPGTAGYCSLAVGTGAAAGSLFATVYEGPVEKLDASTGAAEYTVSEGANTAVSVDQATGDLLVATEEEVLDLDASGPTEATPAARPIELGSAAQGVAAVGEGAEERIYASRAGHAQVEEFGPLSFEAPVPTATTEGATEVTQVSAVLHGTVDPKGAAVASCEFVWHEGGGSGAGSAACTPSPGPVDEAVAVHASATGLTPHATYGYEVVIETTGGPASGGELEFLASAPPTAATEAATGLTETSALLHGTVDPKGGTGGECIFEWGTGAGNYTLGSSPCEPDPGAAEAPTAVSAEATGLTDGTAYHFRVVEKTDGGTVSGGDREFTTVRTPGTIEVVEESASEVTGSSALLEARINPDGRETGYRFQYVDAADFGQGGFSSPATITTPETSLGAPDFAAHRATQAISGLSAMTAYEFRVIATSSAGPVTGTGTEFTTLNAAGLPDGRVAELVSPADKGPLSIAGESVAPRRQLTYQVAPNGQATAFVLAPGAPGTTTGGEVLYASRRGTDGWVSEQLSPPALDPIDRSDGANVPSLYLYLSADLGCSVFSSPSRLTPDTPARTLEAEGEDLYRRNPDGSYTLLTGLVAPNARASDHPFYVVGASPDCGRILFQTFYQYEGVGVGTGSGQELYEWDEAASPQLRHVGVVPGPSGEVAVPAEAGFAGKAGFAGNVIGAVSEDGERVVFTATRQVAGPVAGAAEIGKRAVFLRLGGERTVDASASETTTPDLAASYQDASVTPGGGRVFFLANYGLTADSSAGSSECHAPVPGASFEGGTGAGCDLYEYELAAPLGSRLTDLSADHDPADRAGAGVLGVLGSSRDGAYVYFAALGQLVAGQGESYAANLAGSTYNVYLFHAGGLTYVGSLGVGEAENMLVSTGGSGVDSQQSTNLLSRVTPDGMHFLFESSLAFAGYESGGSREAYVYSSRTGTATCISCRRDGRPPLGGLAQRPLYTGVPIDNALHLPATLNADGSRAFFESSEPLAHGAVAGNTNIYEWHLGTVYLLATGPPPKPGAYSSPVEFVGASEDGSDVFITTPARLASQDTDGRKDLYDLRIGGGFPAEAEPASPCAALDEGACQTGSPPPPGSVTPSTQTFNGPANPPPSKAKKHHKKHKHHHRRKKHHHRKVRHRKKGKKGKGHKRSSKADRRGGR
jgi:hypothetical protein